MPDKDHTLPTLLIVDDEPDNIRIAGRILEKEYHLLFSTTGKDALDIAQTKQPDMILLDIVMPDMDGYTVCSMIRQNPATQDIPIIFVTAMEHEQHEVIGLELGASDYLSKPLHPLISRLRIRNILELHKARNHFKNLAMIDGLTSIPNRRHFDERLQHEWHRSVRSKSPLAILLMDIDYFKSFNDHYGHLGGDATLKRIAAALKESMIRVTDTLARYGGEEFVCLLPETDLMGVLFMAEKLRSVIESLNIPHVKSLISDRVTLSVGGAVVVPEQTIKQAAFLAAADENLYKAKNHGRNCVVCENFSPERPLSTG
ncbi:MAG: diguanylate cyclase [Magnetococcales bacterium]|nr:diguanylate cyclase [Magnetococcales bacterium]